jgi:hypothetical protein
LKILPDKKLFLISYGIAFILNIGEIMYVNGVPKLIAWLVIDNLIYAVIVMVVLRIAVWIGKKAGLVK